MRMVFPTLEYKERAIEFVNEFSAAGTRSIDGSGGLDRYLRESSYEQWLQKLLVYIDIANPPAGKVPSLTYFYVRGEDERIVGMIDIRLALNDFLRNEAGHIGYCVRPSERRRHYATAMLREGLRVLKTIGVKDAIVTCDKDNIASASVIKNNGGELEAELYSEAFGALIQRYVIHLLPEEGDSTSAAL